MKLSVLCMCCLIRSQEKKLKAMAADEETKARYLKEALRMMGESEDGCSAPVIVSRLNKIQEKYFGAPMDYGEIKKTFNALMMGLADKVEEKIKRSDAPLQAAIQYARAGNYIDFGALEKVEEEKLLEILEKACEDELDEKTYQRFQKDLSGAKHLVYLTDNCGEIVMDKLLVRELKRQYPDLEITVIVRGLPSLNDATMEDAEDVDLISETTVMGNGTDVAGTELTMISREAMDAIQSADLIISKGQGNFETLNGCGLNIYYLFLCKCQMFVERFGMEQFKGVFLNEQFHQAEEFLNFHEGLAHGKN